MKAKILYVEDDESLSFVTRDNLELQGYNIVHCATGREALELSNNGLQPDLYILDVMLPDVDGFEIARRIRRRDQQTPILFLTAKSLKEDRLKGLRLGADDYITKPFSIEELILKVEIFLRRSAISIPENTELYRIGLFELDYKNLSLETPEGGRQLTQKEADLLLLFAKKTDQVIRRSDILRELWGEDDYFMGRSLDVFISRLRKYLKPDKDLKLENIHGVGFRLRTGTEDS
ncbi:response regulator transcription factor [Phaeodactylibacter luteus]|uniref:Response regulator transcription factor n=1 Tax=Phaeodactylibacter luteus TaxID=1564516 RepID=A0A5C6S1X9_9BACT|nr:response regulator transcription factor [Phaeodactylibacter luteus]TXB67979.1 response regulator transcription factor [Phaeodactylibacter luteus]